MMKAKELRDMAVPELEAKLNDFRAELFKLVGEMKRAKKCEQPHLIPATKRDIARTLTILKEKATSANTAQQGS